MMMSASLPLSPISKLMRYGLNRVESRIVVKNLTAKQIDNQLRAEDRCQSHTLNMRELTKVNHSAEIVSPERVELRDRIAKQAFAESLNQKTKKVDIILGIPASGKSTYGKSLALKSGALFVDSDNFKRCLPEYNQGAGSSFLHHETGILLNKYYEIAAASKHNLVTIYVGDSVNFMSKIIDQFKNLGYQIDLHFVKAHPHVALRRLTNRSSDTGQFVPLRAFFNSLAGPETTFKKLMADPRINSFKYVNNNNKPYSK